MNEPISQNQILEDRSTFLAALSEIAGMESSFNSLGFTPRQIAQNALAKASRAEKVGEVPEHDEKCAITISNALGRPSAGICTCAPKTQTPVPPENQSKFDFGGKV